MYESKIPGTRYNIALANVKGQWYIQIKLDGIIEADSVVKELTELSILENIKAVVSEVNLYLNDFIIDQITKAITEEAQILLKEVAATAATVSHQTASSEMSAVEETLIQIVRRIETLEERIQRLENRLEHSA